MKDHGPEWKCNVIIEKKNKGNPKIQFCLWCLLADQSAFANTCEVSRMHLLSRAIKYLIKRLVAAAK